jgi:hypothetical protein
MKVIEKWYEKLLGYDWYYRLRSQFTFLEWVAIVTAIVFISWWIYDWLILGIL